MRSPDQNPSSSFMAVLGILVGVAVAQVALAAAEAPLTQTAPVAGTAAVAAPLSGQQVYKTVCIACHSPPGVGCAPALGNADAWAPRIAQGMDTLAAHALNGFTGKTGVMPKKGERIDLSDEEIIGAVEYMVGQVAR